MHLQHDMAYSEQAFARNVLEARRPTTSASRCRRFSSPMASAMPSPSRSRSAPRRCCCRASRSRRRSSRRSRRYRPTVFFGLPTLYTSLTKADGAAAADFSSLRMALSAAEVLSAEVFNGWKTLTGLEIVEGLGSTEALHIYLSNRPGEEEARRGRPARPRLRNRAAGQGRPRGRRQRGRHFVGARRFQHAAVLEPAGQIGGDHPRGRLDLHRRPLRARCRRLSFLPRPRRRPDQDFRPMGLSARSRALPRRTPRHQGMRGVRRRTAGPAHDAEGGGGDEQGRLRSQAMPRSSCRIT